MPTSALMQLPKSKSAEEFESLCVDILPYLEDNKFHRYGRNGQPQNGIDLSSDDNSIVVQCKNYFNPKNFVKQIEADYSEALIKFEFKKFIAMTALDRDVKIQNEVLQIDSTIKIYFWEDIQKIICENTNILRTYYPSIYPPKNSISPKRLNKMIRDLNLLIENANTIHEDFYGYKPAYDCNNDCILYNICNMMFGASCKLQKKLYKSFIQLNRENNLGIIIEEIIRSLPDFHDARYDDCEMLCTITDFLLYFRDEDKFQNYVDNCSKAKELLTKLL